MSRRPLVALFLVSAIAVLSGCSGATVSMQPAEYANDPACADVSVLLPDVVDGEQRRWTDAQATAAWGNPADILFTCGLEPSGPSTLRCITFGGVDWLIDDSGDPKLYLTTYGREPAAQVFMDNDEAEPAQVLTDLSAAVGKLPSNSQCTVTDSFDGEE